VSARVIGGNLRDLSYVATNLRPEDYAEVDCQLDNWSPEALALSAMQGLAYVVEWKGNPEAAFGAAEVRSGLWIAWSWGTRRMWRCVSLITEFYFTSLGPEISARGAWRVEARPLAGNDMAVRWLQRMGATERCLLPGYGKNGEDFLLFDWTRESWNDVLQNPGTAKAEAASATAVGERRGDQAA
jgi:hypothetical protein